MSPESGVPLEIAGNPPEAYSEFAVPEKAIVTGVARVTEANTARHETVQANTFIVPNRIQGTVADS